MISNRRRTLLLKGFVVLFGSWTIASFAFAVLSSNRRATQLLEASALPQLFLPHTDSDGGQPFVGHRRLRQKLPWHEDASNQNGKNDFSNDVEAGANEKLPSHLEHPLGIQQRNPNAPGEMGLPVKLTNLTQAEKEKEKKGWKQNAFNSYVSDLISVRRSLPDMRYPECKPLAYLDDLPVTSVIVCFHNEAWTVLLRTVHSILDRSPPELLKEIILVDDFSDMDHIKKPLEVYMAAYPKVRIVRATKREGLIRARLLGAEKATGPVLTFLDSHVECTEGWLEPLLDRIARDPTTVVCPVIDVINDETLEYNVKESAEVNVGGFDWSLQFSWHMIPERISKAGYKRWQPVESPTMAGGLFSIDANFFRKLGTYDSGFDIWGGENLELSFKTWMCGGRLEIIPCSHVGHIFRKRSPYKWRSGVNVLKRNSVRLAKVWLDDFAKYYFDRIGNDLGDYGDISERIALRKKLNCKPFSWFVKTIYPELFVPGDAVGSGEIRNFGSGGMCIDSPAGKDALHKPVGLYPCHGQGGNQYWLLSKNGEIRRDEACIDFAGTDVILYPCHGSKGNQYWTYQYKTNLIQHGSSRKCLEMSMSKDKLLMRRCDEDNNRQRWQFGHFNKTIASMGKPADRGL
ncbi:putative polypeptide N-acetylgalactosaminyltransferase 9-like [Tropilaelaps mercedesae]|uniref:Polypeptide N-acetylgalactosaminyltransferase n=1 Tax=Tropilaelaps mercedesae TaxID=418985 RepID=A0A1V9Y2B8_9ACAR|nr:putative polypeptide N-acetylgalactosaminyltransferase 9-like [Tropilaelaps mercedesae]